MAIRKTKISSLETYLQSLPGKADRIDFETEQEAYDFGHKARQNAAKEQGKNSEWDIEGISVEVSGKIVRMKVLDQEPVCSGSHAR